MKNTSPVIALLLLLTFFSGTAVAANSQTTIPEAQTKITEFNQKIYEAIQHDTLKELVDNGISITNIYKVGEKVFMIAPLDITNHLITSGFTMEDINKAINADQDALGYTPPGLSKDPARNNVARVVLPPTAASSNPNAGSFASPSTF